MRNFTYFNPTKLIYSHDCWRQLTTLLQPYTRIFALIDQQLEPIHQISAQLRQALGAKHLAYFYISNTDISSVAAATHQARILQADFILAIGGGSVIDTAKFVSCAYHYPDPDFWQILLESGYQQVQQPLAMGSIVTYPAAGSEMNPYFVASDSTRQRKIACYAPMHHPVFTILDPRWLQTLSPAQIALGVADSMIHVLEQFSNNPAATLIQNYQAATILKSIIKEARCFIATNSPAAATNLMLAATLALNGLIECGINSDWTTHWLSHELTAIYGLPHAAAVVALYPSVIFCRRQEKAAQLLSYAQLVWDTPTNLTPSQQINLGLAKTWSFWQSLGLKLSLSAHHIYELDYARIINQVFEFNQGVNLGENQLVDAIKIKQILELAINPEAAINLKKEIFV